MRYKAKPKEIDAFYWNGDLSFKPPQWFVEAYRDGKVMVTKNHKDCYIAIFDAQGMKKAFPESYICKTPSGVIFPLDRDQFEDSYERTA